MIDKLIDKITALGNPTAAGLDTSFDYLPDEVREKSGGSLEDACKAITEFNYAVIDKICGLVPAVKVQAAYYEMYGVAGMRAFSDTLREAKRRGLVTIADVKRNDIGSTAGCYSAAYLGGVMLGGKVFTPFESDFITVNGYLGSDGLQPFADDCKRCGKGVFVLVKTSNPSSGQLQDRLLADGGTLYESVGDLTARLGADSVGKYGYSDIGAVVGATYPAQAAKLRERLPSVFFLIPGYGAQGGKAEDLAVCFDKRGIGGIVNNSRGILLAYRSGKYKGLGYADAAAAAAADMRDDLARVIKM